MISNKNNILRHIAIIMDGNGRWARSKLKPRIFGHKNSISSINTTIKYCIENNIEILTLFMFSRDNWERSNKEVNYLMNLFYKNLRDNIEILHNNNIILNILGDRTRLSNKLISIIEYSELLTKSNTGLKLRLAIDYSGRWDIVEAVRSIIKDINDDIISVDKITCNNFAKYLAGGDVLVDLLIRTSGEVRLSDFMLWQLAYAEMYFSNIMWPDFSKKELNKAVKYFYSRERRFGKISNKYN